MQLDDESFQALKDRFGKEEWRLLKNRKSARKSRRKRKTQYKNLNEEVDALKQSICELEAENRVLKKQIVERN